MFDIVLGHWHSIYFKEMGNAEIIPGTGDVAQVVPYSAILVLNWLCSQHLTEDVVLHTSSSVPQQWSKEKQS